ncbi:MAG: hypothetical protein ACFFDN_07645 [Candidatus Hodarchaeota archaeon]
MKKKNLLSSWKEIALYLDCDIRTCLRWEKKYGLPIHRIDQKSRARVYAFIDELDQWLDKGLRKNLKNKYILTLKKIWSKFHYFILLSLCIGALIILFFLLLKKNNSTPANFKIENTNLIILDPMEKELWRFDTGLDKLVAERDYRDHFQFKKRLDSIEDFLPQLIIKDINQNGMKEVLFSTQTQDELNEGKIFCFNHNGILLWDYKTGRELKFGQKVYSPDYRIHGFDTCDLDDDGNHEIIVISMQLTYFPTQLTVLDHKGRILGEYWNSGQIKNYVFEDLDNDGKKEIILSAMNNEYKKGCLIVFDSANIRGSSPQLNNYYKCRDLEEGSEIFYILIPRTDVGLMNEIYDVLPRVDILANHRISTMSGICLINFEFNYELELLDIRLSHTFERLHNKLLLEGKIKSELNREEYRKKLSQGILYFDGKKWISQRAVSNPLRSLGN